MGRIQSNVGLITGFPITDTVDQLVAISARPRDLLASRTEGLQQQQVAVTELTALVIGVQFSFQQLGNSELFHRSTLTSSNTNLLSATSTGSPAVGTFDITPIRQASSHQLLSDGLISDTDPLGEGTLSFRLGGFVDRGVELDGLNGGAGVERGKIRITDRSGETAIIDLRFTLTIDDVLQAINQQTDVNVTAQTDGDRLRLIDNTGQTSSNLRVQDVAGTSTATDLGLAGIDAAAVVATGQDILSLHDDLRLSQLNDGNGVQLRPGVADLEVTFRDGSTPLQVEFLGQSSGPGQATGITDAANGSNGQVQFTAVDTGEQFDGVAISFVNDDSITFGNETVSYDSASKRLTFSIDAGNTRAADIVNALNNDADASQVFTAAVPSSGNGTGVVDVSDTATTAGGAAAFAEEQSLGELLATINAADPARLSAQISATGDTIELTDLTSGGGTFAVSSLFGGSVAEDLGLTSTATDGVIASRRQLAGLKTSLLSSLGGGTGLGSLGQLSLTDRSGGAASVDLSTAQSLDDVISAIHNAEVGIQARVNSARNGISLVDTSGGFGNLVIASGDATNTADQLRIAVDDAVASRNSGSLDLQIVSQQTSLDSLNNGRGVGVGSFTIADSAGKTSAVNLAVSDVETLGDALDLINGLNIGVEARINLTGDGLLLVDTASGSGQLTVTDVSGTAAADLKIAGESVLEDLNGTPTKVIDGSTTIAISVDADDSLLDLVAKVNAASPDISLSVFNSGSGQTPFRISVTSNTAGAAGALLIDGSQLGIEFQETVQAADALLVVGSSSSNVTGALARSSTNTFDSIIDGVSLDLNGATNEKVTISVAQNENPVVTQLQLFTDQYNRLRDKLDDLTFFSERDNTTGILFGSTVTLQVEQDLARVITSRFFGAGKIKSLGELGLSLDKTGKLGFDERRFRDRYAADSDSLEQFFTQVGSGASAKIVAAAERLAGEGNSVLVNRIDALAQTIGTNSRTIADLGTSLERERESLLAQFFRMEEAIGRLQSNLTAIGQIQTLPSIFSTSRN